MNWQSSGSDLFTTVFFVILNFGGEYFLDQVELVCS
jgi:hypothetical protein